MPKIVKILALALPAVLLLAPAAVALDVEVETAPGVDLDIYATFTWKTVERPPNHPLQEGSAIDLYTRAVLREELTARGLRLVQEGDTPDLHISYDGVLVPEVEEPGVHKHVGPATWIGVTATDNPTFSEPGYRADFVIILESTETGKRVWTGRAKGIPIGGQPNLDKMKKKIKKASRAVLRKYPRQ